MSRRRRSIYITSIIGVVPSAGAPHLLRSPGGAGAPSPPALLSIIGWFPGAAASPNARLDREALGRRTIPALWAAGRVASSRRVDGRPWTPLPSRRSTTFDYVMTKWGHVVSYWRSRPPGANSVVAALRAASSSQSRELRSSAALNRPRPRSRSVSSTAQAKTYRSSRRRSSASRATISSFSLSSSSAARWRCTQSHWRHDWEQNFFRRPGPCCSGSTRRHHPHRRSVSPISCCSPTSLGIAARVLRHDEIDVDRIRSLVLRF